MAQSEFKTKAVTQIPAALRELFRSVLSAREEDLSKINAWARSNSRQVLDSDIDVDSLAEELTVPTGEAFRALRLIGNVLILGEPLGSVDVEGYANALNELGEDFSVKARILLDGIQVEPKEADYARLKGIVSSAILPTLESVGALCDLRAIFQELPAPRTSKTHREGIDKLLGFEPVVVVNLELNDASGDDSNSSFQVTERGLRRMLQTLQEALMQLEIVRDYHKKTFIRS